MERYPLTWPLAQPRTHRRRDADFKVDFGRARDDLLNALKLLGGVRVILSTNVPLRKDGLPNSNWREPEDPGVAVYFVRRANAGSDERPSSSRATRTRRSGGTCAP